MFITGASGFIGRRVTHSLTARGFDVRCASRRPPLGSTSSRWYQLDLADHASVRRLLEEIRPSHLLHLAWETGRNYYSTPDNVRWLIDSLNLIDAFIRIGGRRFVGAGTSAEYDLSVAEDLKETTTPLRPNGIYAACKKALWDVVSRHAAQAGVGHAWGRIFFCYGPEEDPQRPVATLVRALLRDETVPFQEGQGIRDYVYVDDVAEGFIALTASDFNGVVNLGSGEGVSLREFAQRIATEVGRPEALDFGALPTPSYEPRRVVADVTRARIELGWSAHRALGDGIRDTVRWWRDQTATVRTR